MVEFAVILVCLLLNGLFAAVEMAFVTTTKPRLREMARAGNRDAARILRLRENPERTLSVLQIGITAVGAVAAAVGGIGAVSYLGPWLQGHLSIGRAAADTLAIVAVILPMTYFSVVAGELVPKTLALRNPVGIVLRSARWLVLFDRILSPVVTLLEGSTRAVLRRLKKPVHSTAEALAEGEAVELDSLSDQTREYVLNLVDLERRRIRDVRLPWNEVVHVHETDSAETVTRVVLDSGHTRLPVIKEGQVLGILNTKEFFLLTGRGGGDWRALVRPVVRVDESAPILRALTLMQERRSHLSITFNQGRLSGIVTVEDIVEEVIGDLFDEDDDGRLRQVLSRSRARVRIYSSPPGPV